MRQVNENELIYSVRYRLGQTTASLRRQFASPEREKRDMAEHLIAVDVVREALGRLEILSAGPEPLRDLFTAAVDRVASKIPPSSDDG